MWVFVFVGGYPSSGWFKESPCLDMYPHAFRNHVIELFPEPMVGKPSINSPICEKVTVPQLQYLQLPKKSYLSGIYFPEVLGLTPQTMSSSKGQIARRMAAVRFAPAHQLMALAFAG